MKKQSGLTLIELMVAILILGILVGAGVPVLKDLFGRKNITSVGKLFNTSIQLARSEAIQRSATVRVRPTTAGKDWSQGWRLEYTNSSGNNEIIRTFPAIPSTPTFTSTHFDSGNPLEILPNGQAASTGDFYLFYPDCTTGGSLLIYQMLISGIMKQIVSPCGGPP